MCKCTSATGTVIKVLIIYLTSCILFLSKEYQIPDQDEGFFLISIHLLHQMKKCILKMTGVNQSSYGELVLTFYNK